MPILEAVPHNMLQNGFVASDIQARTGLCHHKRFHGFRFEERTNALESLHRKFTVRRVGELVGVDGRQIASGVGGDANPAS